MSSKRRQFSNKFKARVALEALRGLKTISEPLPLKNISNMALVMHSQSGICDPRINCFQKTR